MHGLATGLPIIGLLLAVMVFGPRLRDHFRPGKSGARNKPPAKAKGGPTDTKGKTLPQVYEPPTPPKPQSLQALGQAERLRREAARQGQGPTGKQH